MTVTLALHTNEEKEDEVSFDITKDGRVEKVVKTVEQVREELLGGQENMAASEEEIGQVRQMLREINIELLHIVSEAKLSMMR